MKYDFLIVGAGLFGSVFAERAKQAGKRVLVIDQRNHIGGNCYTEEREGINVHVYGPHIFHTSNKCVWNYINHFAEFNHYVHRVKAIYEDEIYSLPINLMTLNKLWGVKTPWEAMQRLYKDCVFTEGTAKNMEEWCLANVGKQIYETFFEGYTTKHWRRSPKELPANIIKRLPIRFTYDDNYYNDCYQGIPKGGYTQIFENMLDGVEVKLGTSFSEIKDWRKLARRLVFTGRPEHLLGNHHGDLEYLTLRFDHETLDGDFQGASQVNYTSKDVPFTRIVEHKHFEFGDQSRTIITREHPVEWESDSTPYYPVNTDANKKIYQKYLQEMKSENNIIVGGRLGKFCYYDMHQVVANALNESNKEFGWKNKIL